MGAKCIPLAHPKAVSGSVYMVYQEWLHYDSCNVYLITGEHPTLIDCGSKLALPRLRDNLAELGYDLWDIEQIVFTHGDLDHIGALESILHFAPNIRLYLHELEWVGVYSGDEAKTAAYLYPHYGETAIDPAIQFLPLVDGQTLILGNHKWQVLHTPGHTEGSVCFYNEETRLLIAGDTVRGGFRDPRRCDLESWFQLNFIDWPRSMERLLGLDFEIAVNGHDPVPLSYTTVLEDTFQFGDMLFPWFLRAMHRAEEREGTADSLVEASEAGTIAG